MSQHKVKIGAVQSQCSADLEANLAAAERGIRKATAAGAQIICLQELFRSLYFCQVEDHKYFELAEPVPGPTTDKMQELAKELGVVIVPSLFERRAPGIYHNTAAVIDADGTYLGKYRKMHIPDDPLYYEKFYFTPGRPRIFRLGHKIRAHRSLRLLGPMVPRSGTAHGVAWCANSFLSHRHRVASGRKGGVWEAPAFVVGDRAARPRRRQWLLCGRS